MLKHVRSIKYDQHGIQAWRRLFVKLSAKCRLLWLLKDCDGNNVIFLPTLGTENDGLVIQESYPESCVSQFRLKLPC